MLVYNTREKEQMHRKYEAGRMQDECNWGETFLLDVLYIRVFSEQHMYVMYIEENMCAQ